MYNFDLEDRTKEFSVSVIKLCRKLNKDFTLRPISKQLIRSATSIGANYREANGASSAKDFRNKIHLCKKEAKETRYWLEVVEKSSDIHTAEARLLSGVCLQFEKIFGKITATMAQKEENASGQ